MQSLLLVSLHYTTSTKNWWIAHGFQEFDWKRKGLGKDTTRITITVTTNPFFLFLEVLAMHLFRTNFGRFRRRPHPSNDRRKRTCLKIGIANKKTYLKAVFKYHTWLERFLVFVNCWSSPTLLANKWSTLSTSPATSTSLTSSLVAPSSSSKPALFNSPMKTRRNVDDALLLWNLVCHVFGLFFHSVWRHMATSICHHQCFFASPSSNTIEKCLKLNGI